MKEKKTGKTICMALFLGYLGCLCYGLLFWGDYRTGKLPQGFVRINLRPFAEISRMLMKWDRLGWAYLFRNIIGNAIGFAPLGLFLPLLFTKFRSWWKATLAGFFCSLLVESLQLLFQIGIFDVDDLMLNTFGTFLGYGLFRILYYLKKRGMRRGKKKGAKVFDL